MQTTTRPSAPPFSTRRGWVLSGRPGVNGAHRGWGRAECCPEKNQTPRRSHGLSPPAPSRTWTFRRWVLAAGVAAAAGWVACWRALGPVRGAETPGQLTSCRIPPVRSDTGTTCVLGRSGRERAHRQGPARGGFQTREHAQEDVVGSQYGDFLHLPCWYNDAYVSFKVRLRFASFGSCPSLMTSEPSSLLLRSIPPVIIAQQPSLPGWVPDICFLQRCPCSLTMACVA